MRIKFKNGSEKKRFGYPATIKMVRIKYLNNIVEQDHCFVKRRSGPTIDCKWMASTASTQVGIEVVSLVRHLKLKAKSV